MVATDGAAARPPLLLVHQFGASFACGSYPAPKTMLPVVRNGNDELGGVGGSRDEVRGGPDNDLVIGGIGTLGTRWPSYGHAESSDRNGVRVQKRANRGVLKLRSARAKRDGVEE
jgi:hypothetical protein